MSYFKNVPFVAYRFGGLDEYAYHQHLGSYVDLIDRVKDNSAFYSKYHILDGDRPDNLSFKLYETTDYYWTFFLMNDELRKGGWPLTSQRLLSAVQKEKNNTVLTSRDDLTSIFKVGATVSGVTSGATGTVIKRNLDLGQIFVEGLLGFLSTEDIQATEDAVVNSATLVGATYEYNAIHHYEDSDGAWIDVSPYSTPGALNLPVTFHDRYIAQNDDLKEILIIKPDVIDTVFSEFQSSMRKGL